MKVLIVDDHEGVRRALRRILTQELSAELVGEAATGEEGAALVAELRPDVVLLDVQLPGIDGPEAAAIMREAEPGLRIVALTAAADPGSVAAMIAAGADSYLVKTAPGKEIRDGIARILDGQVVLAAEVLPGVVGDLATRLRRERRRADALDELDQMKREFISLISDRLNTPLTSISGYAKTLRNGWDRLPEDMKVEFCERIDSQADLLAQRLAQILSVTRLEGYAEGAAAPFALDAVVREIQVDADPVAASPRVTLDLDEVLVAGDRAALGAAVRSLLDNALVHTDGDVRVRVCADEGQAMLSLDDDGPGVHPEVLHAHLAAPFAGSDRGDSQAPEGMGLSLYITRRIVEAAHGTITVESSPTSGTRVAVRLPMASVG
jgi:signal transduction histidine kinase